MRKRFAMTSRLLAAAPLLAAGAFATLPQIRAEAEAASVAPAPVATPEIAARFYAEHPEKFIFKTPADLPADLAWQGDESEPEFADPAAKRGGTITIAMPSYPPTLRFLGPGANNSWRGLLYDCNEFSLVGFHPNSGKHIPGLALKWAVSADRRTVWFKLDPSVKFNDGQPVVADDYLFTLFLSLHDFTQDAFGRDYYGREFESITRYDDHTIAITLPRTKPDPLMIANIQPSCRGFFKDYGSDFITRHDRRHQPTTGPYRVLPGDDLAERSITLTRVADWWGDRRAYFRHRFNPDRMVLRVIRTPEKSMEIFLAGDLDMTLLMASPKFWHGANAQEPFAKGWIERDIFYNDYPRPPSGFYLNTSKPPLDDPRVRLGLQHAFDIRRVINAFFRGDYDRLNQYAQGFGDFTDRSVKARPFDPDRAMRFFAQAGYDRRGPDGILRNAAGERLSFRVLIDSDGDRKRFMPILEDSAKKAGVEFTVEALERTTMYKKVMQKRHEIVYWSWGVSGVWPDFRQGFHSANARNPDGSVRVSTNNITCTADPEMDRLIDRFRELTERPDMVRESHAMQRRLHDLAVFVPGPLSPGYRLARWRWLRFPEKFDCKTADDPFAYMLFWLDDDIRAETLAARAAGRDLGRRTNIHDAYRSE